MDPSQHNIRHVFSKCLLNNIVRDPFEPKYRKVNLCNPIIKNKVMERKPSISILKSVGFQDVTREGTTLVLEGNTMKISGK